jgi:hypothetical protein
MQIHRCFTINPAVLLAFLLIAGMATAEDKDKENSKNACSQSNPASLCNASNTCGSPSAPCDIDVKRTSYSSSATPNIPNAKANDLICVKTGTTVNWQTTAKDTGFLIDLAGSSPFDPPGTITGGTEKSVSVVAKTPGCFKYNFSASDSRAIYGMSKAGQSELIVIGEQ